MASAVSEGRFLRGRASVAIVILILLVSVCSAATLSLRPEGAPSPHSAGELTIAAKPPPDTTAWTLLGTRPPALGGAGFVYDSKADLFILFGGFTAGYAGTNRTWTYDVETDTWTDVSPVASPTVRYGMGMAYDARADRVILFGGVTGMFSNGETWIFDLTNRTWTNQWPLNAPAGRGWPSLVYDPIADRTILFGGLASSGAPGDTWAYQSTANTWTQIASSGPSGRYAAAMVYDPGAARSLLYGGEVQTGFSFYPADDTWSFDSATSRWASLGPPASPGLRAGSGIAYDTRAGRVVLFGGGLLHTDPPRATADTWTYDYPTSTWLNVTPTVSPNARSVPSVAFDQHANVTLLFGGIGNDGALRDDLWSFQLVVPWPSPPERLTAEGSIGRIDLTWSPPAVTGTTALSNYTLYRGTRTGGETFLERLGTVLSYSDTSVTPGVTYYYRVSATNEGGEGSPSTEASARAPTTPEAPRNLQAAAGNARVDLNWEAPSWDGGLPVIAYGVYRGTSPGSESLLDTFAPVLIYADTAVSNGVTYYYRVVAINELGAGPLSTEASAKPCAPPSAPRNLLATPGIGQVVLTWDAPASDGGSAVRNYSVYRGLTAGGEGLLTTLGDVAVYTDTDVVGGTTYYYTVTAINEAGAGPSSGEAATTPTAPPVAPTEPQHLVAVAGDAEVALTWETPASNGSAAIAGYRIYRGTASSSKSFLVSLGDVLAFTDTGVTNGVTYYYEASAFNSVGEGARSNEASATPAASPTTPGVPNLTAHVGVMRIFLSWTAPSSDGGSQVIGYAVYRGTASGSETLLASLGDVGSYTDLAVSGDVTYYYQVSASNAIGEGAKSNEVAGIPVRDVPLEPRNLTGTAGDRQASLAWQEPASEGAGGILGYEVYRGTTSGGETLLLSLGRVTSYQDTGLTNGLSYYYRVSAVNSYGEGALSNEVNVTPALPPVPPSMPRSLAATAGDGVVTLTWQAPGADGGAQVTAYRVYRGTASGGEAQFAILGNALTYTDAAVTNGATYFYQVSAVNAAGEGARSLEVASTPVPTPDIVPPVIEITAPANRSVVASTSVAVSGTASDKVGVAKVELSVDGSAWVLASGTVSWSGTLSLHGGDNTIYARAIDGAGNVAVTHITVTVQQSPDGGAGPGTEVAIAVGLMAAAAIGILVFFLRRRGK